MREIKSRAWDETNKVMLYPDNKFHFIAMGKYFKLSPTYKDTLYFPMDREIIEELCTGLKDKNGKEIYESDLLGFHDTKYKVEWNDGGFYLNDDFGGEFEGTEPAIQQLTQNYEVIGNIHENPELLNSKS